MNSLPVRALRAFLRRWARALVAVGTFAFTVVGVLLLLNLTLGNKQIDEEVREVHAVSDPQFARSMGALLGGPVVEGNTVQALPNNDRIFPSMLEAIRSARHSITFETYIYWSGAIGTLDASFAAAQVRLFEDDLARARPVTLQGWEARPLQEKFLDAFVGLFSSQL